MKTAFHLLVIAGAFWLSSLASLPAQSYDFTTLAGNPLLVDASGNPIGDYSDGTNRQARLNFPTSVAVDGAGTIFVADTLNNCIRALKRAGTNWVVTTVAGLGPTNSGSADGTNGQAQFSMPQGVAVDSAGNLYVADTLNSTIRQITPAGNHWEVTTIAGMAGSPGTNDGPGSIAQFEAPASVAVDSATNLYVADYTAQTIRRLRPVGTGWEVSTIAGAHLQTGSADGTNDEARFNTPGSIATDRAGRIYVSDWANSTIRMITPVDTNYVVTTLAGKAGEADWVDGMGSDARFTSLIAGIGVDGAGNLYLTDAGTVRKVIPFGTNWVVTTIAGSRDGTDWVDGTGSDVRFFYPQAVGADSAGNLYVADSYNQAIRLGVPLPPILQTARNGNRIILRWPVAANEFTLETQAALPAAGAWTPLTNGVEVAGRSFVLTNNLTTQNAFFRLRRP
jgi:hypothetical protein